MLVGFSLFSALVEKYTFWQNEDDSIIGYEKSKQLSEDDEEGEQTSERESDDVACTTLKITLAKGSDFDKSGFCNSAAEALIQHIPVLGMDHEKERFDPNRAVLNLLNVLCSTPSSLLKRVGMLLSRLDNLSKILVWSISKVQSAHSPASIDLIECPRVNLAFTVKEVESLEGRVHQRLYSGLYIATSKEAREIAERLSGSVSHFIGLQNTDNDLLILIPSSALPHRLHVDRGHLSLQVIIDRRNQDWISNIGEIRSNLYSVHNSLYLMLLYFITGMYHEVFKMVESCVSEELIPEEVCRFV